MKLKDKAVLHGGYMGGDRAREQAPHPSSSLRKVQAGTPQFKTEQVRLLSDWVSQSSPALEGRFGL